MTFLVINALDYEENAEKCLNNALFVYIIICSLSISEKTYIEYLNPFIHPVSLCISPKIYSTQRPIKWILIHPI
jgi:hypothetical protein